MQSYALVKAMPVLNLLEQQGYEAVFVGGGVRQSTGKGAEGMLISQPRRHRSRRSAVPQHNPHPDFSMARSPSHS